MYCYIFGVFTYFIHCILTTIWFPCRVKQRWFKGERLHSPWLGLGLLWCSCLPPLWLLDDPGLPCGGLWLPTPTIKNLDGETFWTQAHMVFFPQQVMKRILFFLSIPLLLTSSQTSFLFTSLDCSDSNNAKWNKSNMTISWTRIAKAAMV